MVAPEDQKEEAIAMEATVTQALPNAMFEVELENGHKLIAYAAGRMRRFFIRITPGDRIRVELSPYDLTRGRIVYRYRGLKAKGAGPFPGIPLGAASWCRKNNSNGRDEPGLRVTLGSRAFAPPFSCSLLMRDGQKGGGPPFPESPLSARRIGVVTDG